MQTINHWQVVTIENTTVQVVLGYLEDGRPVRTSAVQKLDLERRQVSTRHSIYRLGEPAAPQQ